MGAGIQMRSTGKGRRRGRSRRAMSEINVTPFVDVMLVLLIIFMVSAPLLTVGVPVNLPKTAAKALPSDQEEPLSVSITETGELRIQDTPTNRDQLVPKLRAIAAERADDKIYLRADGTNSYATVMEVMGALNAAGFSNIALVTEAGGPRLEGGEK